MKWCSLKYLIQCPVTTKVVTQLTTEQNHTVVFWQFFYLNHFLFLFPLFNFFNFSYFKKLHRGIHYQIFFPLFKGAYLHRGFFFNIIGCIEQKAHPSGANICLRQTFYFIWICIEQTKLFGRDISFYMNLYRAKKMFGRDILLYMKLHRAKKFTSVKSFHANFFLFLLQWYCK